MEGGGLDGLEGRPVRTEVAAQLLSRLCQVLLPSRTTEPPDPCTGAAAVWTWTSCACRFLLTDELKAPQWSTERVVISLLLLRKRRERDLCVASPQLQLFRMVWMLRAEFLSALLSVQLIFLTLVSTRIHRFCCNNC